MPTAADHFIRKPFVISYVIFLMIFSALSRLESFIQTPVHTTDENVYLRLASQLKNNPFNYSPRSIAQELAQRGRNVFAYFNEPLFKHPPLFPYFLAAALKFSGNDLLAAYAVPLFFAVMVIPLVYLLGVAIFNQRTGLLASVFVAIDPVQIISSEKIWMETTLSFFTVLAAFLFVRALKTGRDFYFILSGIAGGLAALTKYPGILSIFIFIAYAFVYQQSLFRQKNFWVGLGTPFILLTPWFYWNYRVYGSGFGVQLLLTHEELFRNLSADGLTKILLVIGWGCLILGAGIYFLLQKKVRLPKLFSTQKAALPKLIFPCLGVIFLICIRKQFLHSFQFDYLPATGLSRQEFVTLEPALSSQLFYAGRLLEFSFVYVFAFLSFFLYSRWRQEHEGLLRLSALVILVFYILWGNYQSRYILAATPFLCLLAAGFLGNILEWAAAVKTVPVRRMLNFLLFFFLIHIFIKAFVVNFYVSFPNVLCYF